MKYTLEMSPTEFIALVDLFKPVVHSYALRAKSVFADESDETTDDVDGADHFVPEGDDNTTVSDEETFPAPKAPSAAPPATVSATLPIEFTQDKNARVVMPSAIRPLPADHPLVVNGRREFFRFIEAWATNFGIEGAEQPDRVDVLRTATANYAGPILAYLRFKGGLVAGTLEFLADSEGNVSPENQKRAVLLATNIAQVGSVLAPEFTDLMEFVRPDGTVIPHVRYEQVRIPQE
jgi:hypothetical protein